MPQVAFGWPIRLASWSVITVSRPARPGATIFGPPLKPAKKCGSTKPVVMRMSACRNSRFRYTGTPVDVRPTIRERGRIAAVVIDDAAGGEDVAPEHSLELGVGVRAMRAGGDEDRDVGPRDIRHLVEERLQLLPARLSARDVADGDGHALALPNLLAERRAADRRAGSRVVSVAAASATAGRSIGSMTVMRSSGRSTCSPSVP